MYSYVDHMAAKYDACMRIPFFVALASCTTGGSELHIDSDPIPPILVDTSREFVIHSDAVENGPLTQGGIHFDADVTGVDMMPPWVFRSSIGTHSVVLEALMPGEATITVEGGANGHHGTMSFRVAAAAAQAFGYRVFVGPEPGYTDLEAGDAVVLAAGIDYPAIPYVRGPGRGLDAGTVAARDDNAVFRHPQYERYWELHSAEQTIALSRVGLPGSVRVRFAEPTITMEWRERDDHWWVGTFRARAADGTPIALPSHELHGTWTITTPDACAGYRDGASDRAGFIDDSQILAQRHTSARCTFRVEVRRHDAAPIVITSDVRG